MSKLTTQNVTDYYKSLSKEYSLATIKKINTLINQCCNYAIENEILFINPCTKAIIPSEDVVAKPKKETPFLTIEDMELLYQESKRIIRMYTVRRRQHCVDLRCGSLDQINRKDKGTYGRK